MGRCQRTGFTLIEMMIVIALISLIALIAIPNLLRSRMAGNEAAAIGSCRALSEAEEVYRRADYDSDGVLEYSQVMSGDFSLFETSTGAADLALIDESLARAEGTPAVATAKAGYVFAILTGQTARAPGGARTYLHGSDLVSGYAFSCVPATYDLSGRNSFQLGPSGPVYQCDRGAGDTAHLSLYDPGVGWTPAE